jgi:type II secretory ATPase GspE/PulE/Tfp pilus assembly ATPase PilB-like protein
MSTRFTQEGILVRSLLSKERLLRYDDIERLDPGAAFSSGMRAPLDAMQADALRALLAGPSLEGNYAEVGARFSAAFAGPHSARRLAARLLEAAEALRATDVHLEPLIDGARVRLRLEGELVMFCAMPSPADDPFVAALKGLSGCLPYRRDVVQEGRIPRTGVGADIRASFVPVAFGERVALRLFGQVRTLEQLGFPPLILDTLRTLLAAPRGLLLVAGASGAGKTTTLYAALAHLATSRPGAHLSLEDPVEQRLRLAGIGVDQVELDPSRGRTGEALLSAALRQDVDVIAVGEVRTGPEAALALQAAHTGRLVLAGVHAGSCEDARQRMLDLGCDAGVLATSLRAVLHQELRIEGCPCNRNVLCPDCRGLGRRRRLLAQLSSAGPRGRLDVA